MSTGPTFRDCELLAAMKIYRRGGATTRREKVVGKSLGTLVAKPVGCSDLMPVVAC
ncbi:hypothetical protein [Nocardia alba]|uniref:hypothetical protein n=1 Tax=Nocardia alba TaxID=225051 RepID=UPI0012ED3F96|nr:hypothetical protein [Nocardia alba]